MQGRQLEYEEQHVTITLRAEIQCQDGHPYPHPFRDDQPQRRQELVAISIARTITNKTIDEIAARKGLNCQQLLSLQSLLFSRLLFTQGAIMHHITSARPLALPNPPAPRPLLGRTFQKQDHLTVNRVWEHVLRLGGTLLTVELQACGGRRALRGLGCTVGCSRLLRF